MPGGKRAGGFLDDETLGHATDGACVPDKFIRQAQAQRGGADVLLQMRVQLFVGAVHHERLDALGGFEAGDHAAAEDGFAGQGFAGIFGQVAEKAFRTDAALGVLHDQADAAADLRSLHFKAEQLVAVEQVVERHGHGGIPAHLVGAFGLVNVEHEIRLNAAAGALVVGVAFDHMVSQRTGKAVQGHAVHNFVGFVGRVGDSV